MYDNLEEYVNGKTRTVTTGYGIETKLNLRGDLNLGGGSGDDGSLSMTIPPLFSRSWADNRDRKSVRDFFVKEGGAIAVTEAICLTHKVDIADLSKKYFVQPFVDSVKALMNIPEKSRKVCPVD